MPTRPAILIPDRLREIRSGNPQLDAQINAILRENQALLFQSLLNLQPVEEEFTAGLDWTPVLEGIVNEGTTFTKMGDCAADDWDSSVYSTEGFPACSVSFRAGQVNAALMVGLNSDPTTDHNYTSIDYAFYCQNDGTLDIYQSGVAVVNDISGGYSTTDQLTVSYDGLNVRYFKNATLVHTAALLGGLLYLDSSFNTSGGAINSVSFGAIAQVSPTALGWAADADGKPAGVRQVYHSASAAARSDLSISGSAVAFSGLTATGIAFGLPAIPVDPGKTYQITVRWRNTIAVTQGRYLRMYEYGSALPSGMTHIGESTGAESIVQLRTGSQDLIANEAGGTAFVEATYTYTPTAGTDYAGLTFLMNSPNVNTSLIVDWVAMTELGRSVDLLPGVQAPTDTVGLNPEAATSLAQSFDAGPFAMSGSGAIQGGDVDTFSPPTQDVDCTLQVTASWTEYIGAISGFQDTDIWCETDTGDEFSDEIPLNGSSAEPVSKQIVYQFDYVGGDTVTLHLRWKVTGHMSNPNDAAYSQVRWTVEYIKR
jgi:hypothetical protein